MKVVLFYLQRIRSTLPTVLSAQLIFGTSKAEGKGEHFYSPQDTHLQKLKNLNCTLNLHIPLKTKEAGKISKPESM